MGRSTNAHADPHRSAGDKNLQFFTLWVALGAGYFQQEGLEPKILVDATPRSADRCCFRARPMWRFFLRRCSWHDGRGQTILLFASLLANEAINLALRKSVANARKFSPGAPCVSVCRRSGP